MNKTALELYLYMGSSEPVINWLKEEGVKNRKEVIEKLAPLVQSNILNVASHIGAGNYGVSLAGTSNSVTKILNAFPEE